MTPVDCAREAEVVAMVLSQRWPEACDDELRAHVETCEVCGEVVTVANILRHDHETTRREIQVPAAGQVWWRAAIRARLEAAQAAARPMTWLHGVAGATAVGLILAVLTIVWPSVTRVAAWFTGRFDRVDVNPVASDAAAMLAGAVQQSLPLVLTIAACILLAPIVLFFALSEGKKH